MFDGFSFDDLTDEYKIKYMLWILTNNIYYIYNESMYNKFDEDKIAEITTNIYGLIIDSPALKEHKIAMLKALHGKHILKVTDSSSIIRDVNLCEIIYNENLHVSLKKCSDEPYIDNSAIITELVVKEPILNFDEFIAINNLLKFVKQIDNIYIDLICVHNRDKSDADKICELYDIYHNISMKCFNMFSNSSIILRKLLLIAYCVDVREAGTLRHQIKLRLIHIMAVNHKHYEHGEKHEKTIVYSPGIKKEIKYLSKLLKSESDENVDDD